jgi:hypothetical protein
MFLRENVLPELRSILMSRLTSLDVRWADVVERDLIDLDENMDDVE